MARGDSSTPSSRAAWQKATLSTVLVAVVMTAVVSWQGRRGLAFPDQPVERILPLYLGMSAFFLAFLWARPLISWYTQGGRPRTRQTLLAGLGAANIVIALSALIVSLEHATDLREWVPANLASGRLMYFLSALAFGVQIFPKLFRHTETWDSSAGDSRSDRTRRPLDTWAAVLQTTIYGFGLSLLGICYNVAEDIPCLSLLSWAIFFVLDDWGLLEHFVVFRGNPLPVWHFLVVSVCNVLIAIALFVAGSELFVRMTATTTNLWTGQPPTGWQLTFGVSVIRIMLGLYLTGLTVASIWVLYRHVGEKPEAATPA
jgi:hypothetical protein